MSGLNSQRTDTASTPEGRKTHVRFDVAEVVAQQEAFSDERILNQIHQQRYLSPDDSSLDITSLSSFNVEFAQGQGWRLQSQHSQGNQAHEQGAGAKTLTTPSGWQNQNTWTKSDQPYGTFGYGGAPSVIAAGDPFYTKKFKAGDNLDNAAYQNASELTSMPFPVASASQNGTMYVVAIDPATGLEEFMYSFRCPGNSKTSPDYIGGITFNGPQGWRPNAAQLTNLGYYCLGFRGNGRADLFVYLSNSKWVLVRSFNYCDTDQVVGRTHRIIVNPVVGQFLNVSGGTITVRCSVGGMEPQGSSQGAYPSILAVAGGPADINASPFSLTWKAPGIYKSTTGPLNGPKRVYSRGDLSPQHQVSAVSYKNVGVLVDHAFCLDFLPDTSQDFSVFYQGIIPAGSHLKVYMYAVTPPVPGVVPAMTALTLTGGSNLSGSTFTPIANEQHYCVRFVFQGNGAGAPTSTVTPYLRAYRVFRSGVKVVVSPGEFSPAFQPPDPPLGPAKLRSSYACHPSITLADSTPSTASASIYVDDMNGDLAGLQQRGDFPTIISTDFVDETGSHNVIFHRGYTVLPETEQMADHSGGWKPGLAEQGTPTQQFNYNYRFKGTLQITGAWQRLQEALLPGRLNLAQDTSNAVATPKVSDVIRLLFYLAGYPDEMLYIPDSPIRIYPNGDPESLLLDPQSNISEVIVRLIKDYFGGYLYFEPNFGTYGTWMVLQALSSPVAASKFLFAFTTAGPGPGKVQNSLDSYAKVSIGGSMVQEAPIYKGDLIWRPKAPEGNIVISYGPSETGDNEPVQVQAVLYNPDSFDFGFEGIAPPSPSHNPDWLSRPRRIWQYLPTWATFGQDTSDTPLNWATRRVYDVSCHGKLQLKFKSGAMIVKDTTTVPGTTIYRPLRFYDPVYVMGKPCIVRDVRIAYDKDYHQFAYYTVEQIIGTGIVQASRLNAETAQRRGLSQLANSAQSIQIESPRHFNSEKRLYSAASDTRSFPHIPVATLQSADGSFPFMVDYDMAG